MHNASGGIWARMKCKNNPGRVALEVCFQILAS